MFSERTKGVMLLLLAALAVSTSESCTQLKPRAEGVENRILVFVSKEDKPLVSSQIDSTFHHILYTPKPEALFEIKYMDPQDFDQFKRRHNLLVVSVFDPEDTTGDVLVRSLLPENQYQMAAKGENYVFSTTDVFSLGQVLTIIAGSSAKELSRAIPLRKEWLFSRFDAAFLKRQEKYIYKYQEQKDLSQELLQKYGWSLRIPHDYLLLREQPEENFVWLGRSFPYRWISVHWTDNPAVTLFDEEEASEEVRQYPQRFYEEIAFSDHYWYAEQIDFNERSAWRVGGLWHHQKKTVGGPFISYLFYDDNSDRLYHINLLIFNPGGKKVVFLRQMEAMAYTFRTVHD